MYKADQGRASRISALVAILLIGFYAGVKWYYWMQLFRDSLQDSVYWVGLAGAMALVLLSAWFGMKIAFMGERSGEFLIDMDGELRKVVWPTLQPLFDPKTEAWGHTYVVIVCSIVFTILIFLIDLFLQYSVSIFLFKMLLGL